MSRKSVRVGLFVLALSLSLASMRAIGGEPPKKPQAEDDDAFGAPLEVAKPAAPQPVVDPFGGDGTPPPVKPAMTVGSVSQTPTAKVAAPANAKPKSGSAPMLHGGEKAILKALNRKVVLEFVETPLKEVVDYLSNKYQIPIVLDANALKDAGVEESAPITIKLSGISLQSALEIILDERKLNWAIHHEALMITSPERADSDEFMYTKLYDVTDIVTPIPDTSIRGTPLTTADALHLETTVRGIAPNRPPLTASGFGVGVGGSMPKGDFAKALAPAVMPNIGVFPPGGSSSFLRSEGLDFQQLTDLIINTISMKSWLDNGGQGTISDLPPGFLVISQTQEVHRQVAKLLADVRTKRRSAPGFRIEFYWLWLDAAHRDTLFAHDGKEPTIRGSNAIVPQRLSQVVREVPGFHSQMNCLNGESTTLVAGDRRSLIVNAIPAAAGGGYQPVVSMPNVGVSAAVQPILQPGTNRAILTVRSTITRWTPTRGPALVGAAWPPSKHLDLSATQPAVSVPIPAAANAASPASGTSPAAASDPVKVSSASSSSSISSQGGGGSSSCPIDLPVMPTQEFGTTLRVSLGKPVIVGSVTFAPEGAAGLGAAKQDAVEVYLIATTSLVEKKASKKNGSPKQIGYPKSE